jgi:hypothetical protein
MSTEPVSNDDETRQDDETRDEAARAAERAQDERTAGEGRDERQRILRLLAEGKITADEAEELLKALEPEQPAGRRRGAMGGLFGPTGPFGPEGPFGPRRPFGPVGAVAMLGRGGAMAPDVLLRWDRPDAPSPPPPPPPPTAPVAPPPPRVSAPVAPPPPRVSVPAPHHPGRGAERSLEFYVEDGEKEFTATLPMVLAGSAERFLPRAIHHYLKRLEVDLATLLEVAQATEDEAIALDGPTGTGRLKLFYARDGQMEMTITLTRPWPRQR